MKLTRSQIASKIHQRLNKTVPKAIIYDAIGIVLDELTDKLVEGEQIPIENLGLLNVYKTPETSGVNVVTGKLEKIESSHSVQLIPSDTLLKFVKKKKEKFERKP